MVRSRVLSADDIEMVVALRLGDAIGVWSCGGCGAQHDSAESWAAVRKEPRQAVPVCPPCAEELARGSA